MARVTPTVQRPPHRADTCHPDHHRRYVRSLNQTIHGEEQHEVDGKEDKTQERVQTAAYKRAHKRSRHARHRRRAALGLTSKNNGNSKRRGSGGSSEPGPDPFPELFQRALKLYPPRHHYIGPLDFGDSADLETWYESDMTLCSQRRDAAAAQKALDKSGGRAWSYRYDWFFQVCYYFLKDR